MSRYTHDHIRRAVDETSALGMEREDLAAPVEALNIDPACLMHTSQEYGEFLQKKVPLMMAGDDPETNAQYRALGMAEGVKVQMPQEMAERAVISAAFLCGLLAGAWMTTRGDQPTDDGAR